MVAKSTKSREQIGSLACIILAAGKGTRMKSKLPKVLHRIYKKPLIGHLLDTLDNFKCKKIVTVVGFKAKEVNDYIGKRTEVIRQKKQLGTADAVKTAAAKLKGYKGNILVLCADIPLIRYESLFELVLEHSRSKASCTVLTATVKDPTGYGRIVRDDNGNIRRIIEEKDASLYEKVIEEINTGIYCFKAEDLFDCLKDIKPNNAKKEYYLTDVAELLWQRGLKVCSQEAACAAEAIGINSRQDLALAHKVLRRRTNDRLMDEGVTIVDPDTVHINEDAKIGQDTVIEPFVRIERKVIIGKDCHIGPFARIREKTKIADNVKVGNFAEIVRSEVDSNTKINHHSYIGDAKIGRDVNIGAGTITANYDGKKKNKTVIKDGAFIGSGTTIVAPATIGSKAITGANSVIAKGKVKNNSIVAGVPAKLIKKK